VEYNAKNICKTDIIGKEQNFNKQIAEFGISTLFQYFMYISAKFSTFSMSSMRTDFTIQYFFNTALEPGRN